MNAKNMTTALSWRNLIALLLLLASALAVAGDTKDQIGVFYFPGWKARQPAAPSPYPWNPIQAFPEKKPLLGWYDEGTDAVARQQIDWMKTYGIDFVVFDWYFGADDKVYLEHQLAAFMRAPNRAPLKFSILWANHSQLPTRRDSWTTMVRYWIVHYFPSADFLRVEGKPVVFVFSADSLKKQAESIGTTTKDLLDSAQSLAHEAGLPGIYFVAGTGAYSPMIDVYAKDQGYSAFSAYNYHQGPTDAAQSHSFTELDRGYRAHWAQFAKRGTLPVIVPMTSGWDKRPWGGSKDAAHDNSIATPSEFKNHLEAAKAFMSANPGKTNGMGVICCWNEFGEGSYIEPTEQMRFSNLEQVRSVFGSSVK